MLKGVVNDDKKHFKDLEAIELVATNVRRYRSEKNLSMQKLANMVGVEYSVIARLEYQKGNPSISVVYAIAKALEIEPYLLLIKQ